MSDRAQSDIFGKTLNPDGTLRAVSPTQIGTFLRCPLKWHFDKKCGLPKKPMGRGASIGHACHGRVETLLTTGQDVRGPLELIGADMLKPYLYAAPFNGGFGIVEGALLDPRLQTPGGILITGYFDYYIPMGEGYPAPIIIDHKWKKSLAKYGYLIDFDKDPKRAAADTEKLSSDPQTIVYGAWALTRQPTAPGIIFRHHQHQTEGEGGRFALPAEVRLTRDDLLKRWGAMAATVDGPMTEAAKVPAAMPGATPEGVPYNIEACSDFGGCDFAATCRHSPQNRFAALLRADKPVTTNNPTPSTENKHVGLLSSIQNQVTGSVLNAPAITSIQSAAPQAPAPALMGIVTADQLQPNKVYLVGTSPARFEGVLGSRPVFRSKAGELREMPPEGFVRTVDEETVCLFEGKPYKKPQAPEAPTQAASSPTPERKKIDLTNDVEEAQVSPPDAPPEVAKMPAPEVQVAVAEVAKELSEKYKAKRGRKPKAEAIQAPASVATETAPAVEPSVVADVPTVDADPKLILLVDCSCTAATDLSFFVKKCCDTVAQRFGAPDVRLGHKNSDLGFGGWKALIALEATQAKPVGICSITSSELADPIIEALAPLATLVVRGRK